MSRNAFRLTSLKLPDDLKRRLKRLAAQAGKSSHALMIELLAREAERSELAARFAANAAQSESETLANGKAHSLGRAFEYLESRAAGGKFRRPRARAWRVSK